MICGKPFTIGVRVAVHFYSMVVNNGENMKKIIKSLIGLSCVTSKKSEIIAQKVFLPYAAVPTQKGLLIINRNYKPIGYSIDEFVDYNSEQFDFLRIKNTTTKHPVFFYDDRSSPWRNKENQQKYQNKINLFFKLGSN